MAIKYQGTVDPTHSAPIGTDYMNTSTGCLWINTDGGTTWTCINSATAGSLDGGAPSSNYGGTTAIDGGTP